MKSVTIASGDRQRVLHRFSNSIPSTFTFTAETLDGGAASGTVEIAANKVPSSKVTETRPLQRVNTIEKRMWDSYFSVFVTPTEDLRIEFDRARMQSSKLIWVLAALVILAAAAGVLIPLISN